MPVPKFKLLEKIQIFLILFCTSYETSPVAYCIHNSRVSMVLLFMTVFPDSSKVRRTQPGFISPSPLLHVV